VRGSIGPMSSSSGAASFATARLLFRWRMSRRSCHDSNGSSSTASEGKAATTSLPACAHTWHHCLGQALVSCVAGRDPGELPDR
jgi:hypothetical protein